MGQAGKSKEHEVVVNVHEAKTHFSKLLRRVQSGQTVIIAKASKPIARIVPLTEAVPSRRAFGAFKAYIDCAPDAFDVCDDTADLFEGERLLPEWCEFFSTHTQSFGGRRATIACLERHG